MRMRRRSNSKYGNVRIEYDGQMFDSIKERDRYIELQLLQKAGEISELQRQVKFELQPAFYHAGHKIRPIIYVCDFYYKENDKYIIEDVKSPATRNNGVYKLKKKRMMYLGYEIKEI